MPSYTYELLEPSELLSRTRSNLKGTGGVWDELAPLLTEGHVEYKPIRNNPMRSGYQFVYKTAKLNITMYFPEAQFNRMLELLDGENLEILKGAVQAAIPPRSGYFVNEFKIKGILEPPD
ncbi:MAG: hypothetical protein G3M78_14810 [Candidatus Nitrohelix vancouverensis]|uniref:Uncharacterized protein n=1 Tax=Candidatus Nitrohelix vancouverensis TaxID=2705534 RepID=A0A7T0G4P5_9BACT|nr:MAG: hypothetical protein G3M78_14810 [Candidatus Nitrohelix vancouverensis]